MIGIVGGERMLVNLQSGAIAFGSTDAINGGQLYTANQRLTAAFGGGAGLDSDGQLTAPLPLNVIGGYGNGGGTQHTAYVGVGGEF